MKKYDQSGSASSVVAIFLLVIALVAVAGFAYWAFTGRQDYKNNVDKKIAAAVTKAKADQSSHDNDIFAEQAKSPYRQYIGPAVYGSVAFHYPRTWSAYVDETSSTDPIKGYFHPNIVPSITGQNNQTTQFALKVELLGSDYSTVVGEYDSAIMQGDVKAIAYLPPQMKHVPGVQIGTKLDGMISQDVSGSMVIIKVRDKTLKIYTESPKYLGDFNNIVLNSLSFRP